MKFLITGFFGEGNLGDDAILQAICQNLPAHCGCIVTSGRLAAHRGQPISRRGLLSWPAYINALRECNGVIFSGGILQDWSFEGVTFFALRILAASYAGCPPTIWGAGLGPLRSTGTRQIARRALKRVNTVWLRDESSLQEYHSLTGQEAHHGADWSWFIPINGGQPRHDNGPMALNLRDWPYDNWKPDVAHQLRHNERRILGLSARSGDIRVIKELAPTAAILQPENFSDFALTCHNVSYGLAMRYHAALAMIRAGVPLKLIAYDNKVKDLAKAAGLLTIQQNQVTGFKTARAGFIAENEARLALMQTAFKRFVAETEQPRA